MNTLGYLSAMSAASLASKPHGLALLLGWRRVLTSLGVALALGLLLSPGWSSGLGSLLLRAFALGLLAMLVFGVFEQWPRRLPAWLARWVLQVFGVALAMPLGTWVIYAWSTPAGAPPFWTDADRLEGFGTLSVVGLLFAPWIALGALVRQKDAFARHQALAFELERSELERQALDARLHLMQAQVAPHFLFNTLANVQALVETGSPQAPALLRSLIAYLRAAVPRLHDAGSSFEQELQLVRAYLELMHMRMPDRLQFNLQAEADVLHLHCPPMSLLTLVENAVRHGIDPSEEGGTIELRVQRRGERCLVCVDDSGVGLGQAGGGLGTGLAMLRERLRLSFGETVQLRVVARSPRGTRAELDLPAREAAG